MKTADYRVIIFTQKVVMRCFTNDIKYSKDQPYLVWVGEADQIKYIQAMHGGTTHWVPASYLPDDLPSYNLYVLL